MLNLKGSLFENPNARDLFSVFLMHKNGCPGAPQLTAPAARGPIFDYRIGQHAASVRPYGYRHINRGLELRLRCNLPEPHEEAVTTLQRGHPSKRSAAALHRYTPGQTRQPRAQAAEHPQRDGVDGAGRRPPAPPANLRLATRHSCRHRAAATRRHRPPRGRRRTNLQSANRTGSTIPEVALAQCAAPLRCGLQGARMTM